MGLCFSFLCDNVHASNRETSLLPQFFDPVGDSNHQTQMEIKDTPFEVAQRLAGQKGRVDIAGIGRTR